MAIEDTVWEMEQAALHAALLSKSMADTPETRAAYARGVRAMASLVHACVGVAEQSIEEHRSHPLAATMFTGYARALRKIVEAADDLIPPGYE